MTLIRYSLSKLANASFPSLLEQVVIRSSLQSSNLRNIKKHRATDILTNLYNDTSSHVSEIVKFTLSNESLHRSQKKWLESLLTRHGLVTETLSDIFHHFNGNSQTIENTVTNMLVIQTSLNTCLEQIHDLVGETPGKFSFIRQSSLKELCQDVKLHAIALADHQEGWSPSIEINDQCEVANKNILCISSRLQFVLLEILKNALYSSIKRFKQKHPNISNYKYDDIELHILEECTPITINIYDNEQFYVVEVIDRGIGMSSQELQNCFRFLWSTTRRVR
jgi:hypothetical protein